MPYGSINLRHGVPPGETTITCAAGVGTFVMEFGVLSRLTGMCMCKFFWHFQLQNMVAFNRNSLWYARVFAALVLSFELSFLAADRCLSSFVPVFIIVGDMRYENAALAAMEALHNARLRTGLVSPMF